MARIEKLEHNMAKIYMEVTPEEFDAACAKAYAKQKGQFSVPGFRKGKATRKMIEKMYGKGVFYEEAINSILPDLYEKTYNELKAEGNVIVSRPSIDIEKIEEGQNVVITAECALDPEVTLGEYKGIVVEKETVAVTEDEIAEELKKDQERNVRTTDIAADNTEYAAKMGDDTTIDFDGYVDGAQFEGGKAENYALKLGSHSFVDTFEDQIVGHKIGDAFDVNVTFPENYKEDLAGKAATFKVVLKGIKSNELPELNDDYAKDYSEFDTLDEMKEDLGKKLLAKKQTEADNKRKAAILDKVVENASMDIPAVMIEERIDSNINNMAQNMRQYGISMDQYFQMMGTNAAAFRAQMKPGTEKALKEELVLRAIAKAENIEVTEDEFKAELTKMAESYNMKLEDIEPTVGEDEKEAIMDSMKSRKADELIVAEAKEA